MNGLFWPRKLKWSFCKLQEYGDGNETVNWGFHVRKSEGASIRRNKKSAWILSPTLVTPQGSMKSLSAMVPWSFALILTTKPNPYILHRARQRQCLLWADEWRGGCSVNRHIGGENYILLICNSKFNLSIFFLLFPLKHTQMWIRWNTLLQLSRTETERTQNGRGAIFYYECPTSYKRDQFIFGVTFKLFPVLTVTVIMEEILLKMPIFAYQFMIVLILRNSNTSWTC